MKIHKFMTMMTGIILSVVMSACSSSSQDESKVKIGIIQTVSHPALDQARDGFMSELTAKLGTDVSFVIQNAEGSISQARSIAQSFHADPSIDGIFAIATPAAQAAVGVEKNKPIIFGAVTDPARAGLLKPGGNACGTSDRIDVKAEIDLLQTLVPNAKKVAVLFSVGEVNSVILAEEMHQELTGRGFEVVKVGMSQEFEVASAMASACRQADVVLTPTDNLVAVAMPVITKIAREQKKPLIVSDNLLVVQGALASRGIEYSQSGKEAGRIAFRILVEGEKPENVALASPKVGRIVVNRKVLDELGLTLPDSLGAEVVNEGGKGP